MALSSTVNPISDWFTYPAGAIHSQTCAPDLYDFDIPKHQPSRPVPQRPTSGNNVLRFPYFKQPINTTALAYSGLSVDIRVSESKNQVELDDVLACIRSFAKFSDGWDGDDSFAPKPNVVDDAIVVLQSWPGKIQAPEPALGCDGNIALELFDPDGFSMGGVELVGDHRAVFTVINRSVKVTSGSFDSQTPSQILHALAAMEAALV